MAARGEGLPQRDRRERVPRVAEGGEQEPAPVGQAAISASSRIIRVRPSASKAIGEHTSVPTPASR